MYTFIVNPHSRSGLGQEIWTQIHALLTKQDIKFEVIFTEYQRHATKCVHQLTSDGMPHTIIVLGGDGTINEVLNGIVDFSLISLGYIPTGSSNDFARGLQLPVNPAKALDNILNRGATSLMDVGILHYRGKGRCFGVSTGIGFDAAICHQAVVSKLKVFLNKLRLGKLTYGSIAMNRLFLDPLANMTITIDEAVPMTFTDCYFATVMNLPYEGGGFKFCPDAVSDDGLLDVIVVNHMSKKKVLALFPTAINGHHTKYNGVHIFRGRNIRIQSSQALAVHTDGEPVFLQKDISVSIAPKQIHMITSHKSKE